MTVDLPPDTEAAARALLVMLLRAIDIDGRAELLRQAKAVRVSGEVTFLDLEVPKCLPASPCPNGHFPRVHMAIVYDATDQSIGELMFCVAGGYLDHFEFGWWSDDMPTQLPPPEAVRFVLPNRGNR